MIDCALGLSSVGEWEDDSEWHRAERRMMSSMDADVHSKCLQGHEDEVRPACASGAR